MPRREIHPIEKVAKEWLTADDTFREHVRSIWPDLASALESLARAQGHIITDPASVRVPPMAPPSPAGGSSRRSPGRGGSSGTDDTSGGQTGRKPHQQLGLWEDQ